MWCYKRRPGPHKLWPQIAREMPPRPGRLMVASVWLEWKVSTKDELVQGGFSLHERHGAMHASKLSPAFDRMSGRICCDGVEPRQYVISSVERDSYLSTLSALSCDMDKGIDCCRMV